MAEGQRIGESSALLNLWISILKWSVFNPPETKSGAKTGRLYFWKVY